MSDYAQLPHTPILETSPFRLSTPPEELQELRDLVRLSKLGPRTYENSSAGGKYGVEYEWMAQAKERWAEGFDWTAVEARVNEHPNFKAKVIDDDGASYSIHFIGLFSQKKDAIPLMCIHGWPGSFLEFIGFLSALKAKYTPQDLPYHVIIPSLPGYAFSDSPPVDRDWVLQDSARLLHKLMVGLGFEGGYAVQGGDIGSYTARIMARTYDSCKVLHLNFCAMTCPEEAADTPLEEYEREALERSDKFVKFGTAIGEKFLTWTHETPSMDEILASVTLYWLTQTFPRGMYPYRQEVIDDTHGSMTDAECRRVIKDGAKRYMFHPDPKYYCEKPMGYSWFPYEIVPVPKAWAATTGNLVWYRPHDKGGHFAGYEQPEALLGDVEDFLKQVWV
ncbi:putative epoxide hydrolase [Colletotrichum aenigma]|uniref:putative epoxide hydrolase n=1 Tax=Colletotrichum aenigma TaxID=1215731 RepID=UPI00187339FB|nr:putative epoxide hydrolase [Colletotrichum aenigma]KAF5522022.1 putative epoxide hydrolase [Colletotrichum aenigma]